MSLTSPEIVAPPSGGAPRALARRNVRLCYFNVWADALQPANEYVAAAPTLDLRPRVAQPADAALLAKARLDCDWYAENARCFASLAHPEFEFQPAWVCGPSGLLQLAAAAKAAREECWLVLMGQQPQALGPLGPRLFALLRASRVRIAFYAFDEASRFMAGFRDLAPFLDVLIHDESPLEPGGAAALRPDCVRIHRSWVANLLPFAAPFNEAPEAKILFLGSQLGLTEHRKRQIEFLRQRFRDRLVAIHDHSVAVRDRLALNRFKVSLCPEGRKFGTPGMSATHTDRPFWSGCLGMVPVTEDSRQGGRLEELAAKGVVFRYPHGDLEGLAAVCEWALDADVSVRRRVYEHFNRYETVGTVLAEALAMTKR